MSVCTRATRQFTVQSANRLMRSMPLESLTMTVRVSALSAEVSQTVILTRMEGRTPVPEKEKLSLLAQHGASMAVFLSAGHLKELQEQLCEGVYTPDTPCAIVYKASWAEQKCIKTTIKELEQKAREAGITKTALVLVGDFLGEQYAFSKLYDPEFQTEYRK